MLREDVSIIAKRYMFALLDAVLHRRLFALVFWALRERDTLS